MASISTKFIKGRIKSIRNIQKITRAMMLVSCAKLSKVERIIKQIRPYSNRIFDIMEDIALKSEKKHPFLMEREIENELLIILTSKRGLCGSFNTNIIRAAEEYIKNASSNILLLIIGKRGEMFFKNKDYKIMEIESLLEKETELVSGRIAKRIMTGYLSFEFDKVTLIYNEFISVFRQVPKITSLIPIIPKEPQSLFVSDYIYEPDYGVCLDSIFSLYFRFQLLRIFFESLAAEHAARMIAMENATKNAENLIKELFLTFNQTRQAGITKEITEIVSAGEAI
ncbi:MAG: ATP synthase F1 subunit gamma [bacterium]